MRGIGGQSDAVKIMGGCESHVELRSTIVGK